MKKITTLTAAAALALGITIGGAAQAEASIGYAAKTCYAGRAGKFTVSSWRNDSNTQKTYHYRAETTNWKNSTVREVKWLGVVMLPDSNTLVQEGYRYSSYLGTSNWSASFQNYYASVPTNTSSCGFSI